MKINIKVFYKLIPSFLETIARRAQRTQNNKSAISVWYFKKEERDKVYFMKLDQQKTFLQIDAFNFGVYDQSCLKYSKCQICNIFGVTEKKNPTWGYFFNGVSRKVFCKLILPFVINLAKRFQMIQKILHYFCNVSRKKLGMKITFCMQVNAKVFHKLILSFLTGVTKHNQNTQYSNMLEYIEYIEQHARKHWFWACAQNSYLCE